MEKPSQLGNDWKVIGAEGHEGASFQIRGYVGRDYCEVMRGGVSARGGIEVDEQEVGICD